LIVASALVTIAVGFAGPSAVALKLGPSASFLPPWSLPWELPDWTEWIVVPALWLGVAAGTLGLWIANRCLADGWRPNPWRLYALGAALSTATALVLPLTSADVLMYAAYGRLQAIGNNPYDITPASIFRQEFDPVLVWTERPWQDTPSVYGPLASGTQWLAATLGGANAHDIVFWLQLFALVPFLAIGAIAIRVARRSGPQRAALFTVLNPLLIWSVVAGAHNDALTVVFAVAALAVMRRRPLLAGALIGLAGTVKVSLVFYGLAMVWAYRRDARKLLLLLAGAAVPLVLAYGLWMPRALLAAMRNLGFISAGSWATLLYAPLVLAVGPAAARAATTVVGWVGTALVAWMLSRILPWQPVPGVSPARCHRDPPTVAARGAVVLTTAWLICSPFTMSWYDLMIWAPLGILGASKLVDLLLWRGGWLSLAYVTGRAYAFGPAMLTVSGFLRDVLCAPAQALVLAAVARWWWKGGHARPSLDRWRRRWKALRRLRERRRGSPTALG
jgi:hypothetical protein